MANLCPKCRSELVPLADEARTTIAYGCRDCGGVFVENAVLDRLSATATGLLAAVSETAARWGTAEEDRPALCMVCAEPMARWVPDESHGVRGLVLERCDAGHGTWFDARELTFLAQGLAAQKADVDAATDRFAGSNILRTLFSLWPSSGAFRRAGRLGL